MTSAKVFELVAPLESVAVTV
jgi:hypothetical protein